MMTGLRILHLIGSLDPATGGPPAVAARLAAAQGSAGSRVTIGFCSPNQHVDDELRHAYRQIPGMQAVTFAPLPCRHGLRGQFSARAARPALDRLVAEADIVHLHGVWEALLRAAAANSTRRNLPYVLSPHGMLHPWSLAQKAWKKRLALLLGYRRMLNGAAFLHVLNDDERRLLQPLGLRCPMVVVPNGVFFEELDDLPPAGTFRAAQADLWHDPYVLFLSRLHFKKGLDYLADAFARVADALPGVRLVVAGPDEGARDEFERRVRRLGITHRVHLVGPLYGRDKLAALVDAACFCLPSRQEGFSVAVTEALAVGVPVVISEGCNFPEVAEAGAGRVVPLDAGAVAGALREVLADAEVRRRMGEAGRELVRGRFTWPQIARQMLEAYREAIDTVTRAAAGPR